MTMVWGDPAGFAVDWDWQRGLTAGRRRPPQAAARRWWRKQGRTEALGAVSGSARLPAQ